MNARVEADAALGGRYDVRVLEPSPPAVTDGPWLADDPVERGEASGGRPIISPVGTGDLRWVDLDEPALDEFRRERWLGPWKRLERLPAGFAETRGGLHRVAERVLKPAREHATGKFGLRFTRGGFGTPFFGADVQLRVEHGDFVRVARGVECRAPLDTLAACARVAGSDLPRGSEVLPDEPLGVDRAAASAIGDWFGFAASVLEELRAESNRDLDPSRVQIWPEHFDMALELGSKEGGTRAAYGLSPGDDMHPEPYVYVAPWDARPSGELWNASAFVGAELSYAELLDAPDQRETALDFLRARVRALNKSEVRT